MDRSAPVIWLLLAAAFVMLLAWWGSRRLRRLAARVEALESQLAARQAELRSAFDQMREARLQADAADLAKTRFLAAASHDLRQPAHALGLYLAALREAGLEGEPREIASRMSAALEALESMLAALLDLSRIDAGVVQPQWEVIALAPLLQRVAAGCAAAAEARGLRLAVRIADADAGTVTDPVLLERLIANLLSNAVKYTQRGGVLLACRRRTGAGGSPLWRIEVWDSGIGIGDHDRERVFEEFVQLRPDVAAAAAARPKGAGPGVGLGLGLAIVQRLARLLNLRLALSSRPGRGSVFFVEGLAPAGQLPLAAAAARAEQQRLGGARVALLEDDAASRDAMGRLLQRWGLDVTAAPDADGLLAAFAGAGAPSALIADLDLGGAESGLEQARRLAKAWGREPPLLLISADAAALAQHRAEGQAGLAKPVSPPRLRAWLEQVLDARAEPAATPASQAAATMPAPVQTGR